MFKGYDFNYYYNLLKIYSHTAEKINTIRWNWVKECDAATVLDYGCGVGWFKAFAPVNTYVDTYDIMPVVQTGINLKRYDLITFWDVLEHIEMPIKFLENILQIASYVAVTIPVMPKNLELHLEQFRNWKHNKPGEHINYFYDGNLEDIFKSLNFSLIKKGQPECPPREDIFNYLFKRRQ